MNMDIASWMWTPHILSVHIHDAFDHVHADITRPRAGDQAVRCCLMSAIKISVKN